MRYLVEPQYIALFGIIMIAFPLLAITINDYIALFIADWQLNELLKKEINYFESSEKDKPYLSNVEKLIDDMKEKRAGVAKWEEIDFNRLSIALPALGIILISYFSQRHDLNDMLRNYDFIKKDHYSIAIGLSLAIGIGFLFLSIQTESDGIEMISEFISSVNEQNYEQKTQSLLQLLNQNWASYYNYVLASSYFFGVFIYVVMMKLMYKKAGSFFSSALIAGIIGLVIGWFHLSSIDPFRVL